MNISYTLQKNKYINFYAVHFKETNNYKNFAIIRAYISIVSVIIIFILTLDIPSILLIGNASIPVFILGTLILFSIIRKKAVFYFIKFKLNKLYSLEKYKYLFKYTTISLTNSNIKYTNDLIEINLPWKTLKNICVFDDYIFIVSESAQNILIPCTVFREEIEKEEFLKYITNNTEIKVQNNFPKDFIYFV